ncbi:MAG: 16S rRNA (adenine(1518)-N(6)/adenine(1519)-N(6))-dimethyltransferase RsmA [Clostridiales bacterium]|nr:16S rRNA (adenine(1518)-N(6)/adenine(1519)-N(6))-dimethyltransferase RsmA [Clostridiales bacterium]
MSLKKQSGKAKKEKTFDKSGRAKTNRLSGSIKPQKSLGQNFLVDEGVVEAIIEGSNVNQNSLVIEIGPGTGVLTCPLADRAGKVIAIELDERMISPLRVKTFSYGNVSIIHEDILKVDLNKLIEEELQVGNLNNVRVVGNLPYYITTPIIMKLLESNLNVDSITAMMQKEVGDRIAAEPGTKLAGAITYSVNYYAEVTKVIDVERESFFPIPKVDSVVLRMDLRKGKAVHVTDETFLFKCIKAGFSQRRKTLLNSLTALENYKKNEIEKALTLAGIEKNRRAESLSMEEFASLAKVLQEE